MEKRAAPRSGIVNRRELRARPGRPRGASATGLADVYADEHLPADSAAAEGFVHDQEIIEPAQTRDRLATPALEAFAAGAPGGRPARSWMASAC